MTADSRAVAEAASWSGAEYERRRMFYEYGVCFANYEGFQVGDTIECYSLEELPRSL